MEKEKECFCIQRMRKLIRGSRGKNSVGVCLNHLEKHLHSADISRPERTEENDSWQTVENIKKKISEAIQEHNSKSRRALRKDASVLAEFIFTYSPEAEEKIDPNEFEERIFKYLEKEFPSAKVLRVDYHADESCEHWHILILPTTERGTLSAKEVFGGPEAFRKHQDHFAECVADLGLRRGIAKEVRKQKGEKTHHEPLWRWKAKQVEQKEKELQELNEAICKKKEQLEKDRAKEVEEILSDIFDEER